MILPRLTCTAAILSITCDLNAQEPLSDLNRLKQSYESAVERAVTPVREAYRKELQKLLEKTTRAGKLDEAVRIKEVLDGLPATPGQLNGGTAKPAVPSPKDVERLFVGKTWATPTGTKFSFEKEGKGIRRFGKEQTAFVWDTTGVDTVEATGQRTAGSAVGSWYFRFVTNDEALFGDAPDSLNAKLKLERR